MLLGKHFRWGVEQRGLRGGGGGGGIWGGEGTLRENKRWGKNKGRGKNEQISRQGGRRNSCVEACVVLNSKMGVHLLERWKHAKTKRKEKERHRSQKSILKELYKIQNGKDRTSPEKKI